MTDLTTSIIATARRISQEAAGEESDEATMLELALMVSAATHGVSAGFLRLPPGRAVEVNPRQPRSLEE